MICKECHYNEATMGGLCEDCAREKKMDRALDAAIIWLVRTGCAFLLVLATAVVILAIKGA